MPAKKKGVSMTGPPQKGIKNLRMKKKMRVNMTKPPAPGERKAMRKRVVFSNTNALVVPGLQDVNAQNCVQSGLEGQVLGIPGPTIDQLTAVGAFQSSQGWRFFRRPAALVRRETAEMARLIADVESVESRRTMRKILVGEQGSGKSTLVLQTMAMAFLRGWVVINFPDAQELAISHTEYGPIPGTNPTQYSQKIYTADLLSQVARANRPVLSKLQISQKHNLPVPVQRNISLDRFAEQGASDPELAWPFFQALWSELMQPSTGDGVNRPPVMLALDGVHHIMKNSNYMSADFKPIHAHDLALVSFFTSYLSGSQSLANGGLVIAAVSESNRPNSESLDFAIGSNEAAQQGQQEQMPYWDPYKKLDDRVMQSMSGVEVLRLGGLSKGDAKAIMEYYAKSGMLRQSVSDALVAEKWALSGRGIIGALEKNSVMWRL
ncbi:hypothetical protein NA57DRAFT_75773 [Rhizodiscina lignyota]|uniref:Small ribosomal subunit protein mS29 n=1 Tax=Rhizodiscina lignyota TaxID=1504668 RepID=A0A9P4M5V3_9PEZI|nr:hypothetical protein NA57DRAFT_75773 [Rhizodiscina lignyota]